jgi:hypothetical protein
MSEEQEGGMSTLKKTILGIGTTIITGAGAYVTTHIDALFGIEEEAATEVAAPVQNNQQSVNVTGPEIIINMPEQKAAPSQTTIIRETVKEVPAAPVEVVEEKPETNAERMARLKKAKEERNAGK